MAKSFRDVVVALQGQGLVPPDAVVKPRSSLASWSVNGFRVHLSGAPARGSKDRIWELFVQPEGWLHDELLTTMTVVCEGNLGPVDPVGVVSGLVRDGVGFAKDLRDYAEVKADPGDVHRGVAWVPFWGPSSRAGNFMNAMIIAESIGEHELVDGWVQLVGTEERLTPESMDHWFTELLSVPRRKEFARLGGLLKKRAKELRAAAG